MSSWIYCGSLWHARREPVSHEYTYPVYALGLDLDELPALDRSLSWFGYNRRKLVSLYDDDYLRDEPGTLRDKLRHLLGPAGDEMGRVILVTSARVLGYVFNPVSFFHVFRADESLLAIVAEVNNTFGDKHVYVLKNPETVAGEWPAKYSHPKEFHVSPFNDLRGLYRFSFADVYRELDICVDLERDGRTILQTRLRAAAEPLTQETLKATLRRYPLTVAMTMPRIVKQAAVLYYRKKLRIYHRPVPAHPMTVRVAPPTGLERLYEKMGVAFFSRLQRGRLKLSLPGGRELTLGQGSGTAPEADLAVHQPEFFRRLILDGDIGFGESFMAGEWDSSDLTGLLRLLADNLAAVDDRKIVLSWLGRGLNRVRHAWRKNTLFRSRRNIEEHYDLSNEFFRLWLDETMMYSSAFYARPEDTLHEAQLHKLRMLINKARIRAQDHVLEIGSGWGGFAIEAARSTGCRVTTITLSTKQRELAMQRVREAGLEGQVSVELCDYRRVQGQYDRIVSIEMLEAVGHEYFGTFFRRCDELLKPEGLVVLQVICIPDQRYDTYRRASDWTQKYIFPGGILPSLTVLSRAMTRHSRLIVEHLENIGPHYARTLKAWRERFLTARNQVRALGFDEVFLRKWEYYLAYCEAGFAARVINDLQLVLTRPNNPLLDLV